MQNPASNLSSPQSAQNLAQSAPPKPNADSSVARSALAEAVPMNDSHSSPAPSGHPVQRYIGMRERTLLLDNNPALAKLVATVTDEAFKPTLEEVADLLSDERLTAECFKDVAISSEQGYTRNTLIRTDQAEITLIKWQPGQFTSIHNHKGSACALKIMEGDITEIKYEQSGEKTAKEVSRTQQPLGTICASKDEDIHALINQSSDQEVSCLHLYMPPVTNNTIFTLDKES